MPQSRSAMIIERAPLPIVEVQGSAHMVSHVNSAFCRLLGKTREDLVGKSFADIVHGGNQCMPILDRVYQTGEAATLAQEDESDPASTVWLYAMWPALDANEQPVGVIIQLAKAADFRKDTTAINEALLISGLRQHELKDAAEKLTQQLQAEITARRQGDEARAILATIVESSEDAIISKDLNGTIATWNRGAERLFGYSAEEAIGQPITMLFPPDKLDEEAAILAGIRSGKPVKPYETVRCRKDGTLVDVALSVSPILDARGEIVGVAKIVRDITERKRAADRILRSEENYRLLVESATGFAIIRLQLDGTVSSWNVGAERILGYRDAEILGAHFSIFFTPEDLTAGRPGRELRAASHLEKGDDDNWLVRMDGSRFWASGATTALRDEAGNLRGYAKIVRDMTGQRAANEQLRAIEARKSAILDGALDGIITMDHEGKVVDFNPAAEAMFGIARAEIVGQRMAERIIPERLRESHYRGLAHYLASGEGPMLKKRIEVHALHADGHEFMIELSINRIAGVEPAMFTATLRDITERQRAEVALRESELHFRALADNIPQLSWMTDATGAIFWYNQRWFDFTGTTLAQMEGWGWQAVNHPDHLPRILERWQASLAAGTNFEDTFPLRGADGEYRWFLTRAVPIRDESGNVQRWFGTNTDVTAQRDAADALALAKEQVEAVSRAKDDFLAALSHELRTPLTPVLMMAADLAGDPAVPIEVRDQLAMMRRNIELEARLIDDLLDLTRISKGKLQIQPTISDLHQLLEQTAEIVRSDVVDKQVPIHFAFEAARHHAMGDPARLQQVFWNIIKNALKFTLVGGSVTVRTRNNDEGQIIVSVTDTGIGIRAEALSQIFEAFEQGEITFQQRFGGLGLGLAISRAIVELHGGEIRAESDGVGQGATFTVTLATVDAPKFVDPAQSTPPALNRSLRLLVVEDHEATLAVLTRLLTRSGHHLTSATSVCDGLAAAKMEPFDAVISDLGLPDGTGFELMEKLRAAHGLRGIAVSGYGMDDDVRRSEAAGFAAHLTKPIDFAQLERALEDLMAGAS